MGARPSIPAGNQPVRTDDAHLEEVARQRIVANDSLRRFSAGLQITSHSGAVRLTGRLPSFYLKQMLQTTLRHLPGCERIENEVEVGPQGDR